MEPKSSLQCSQEPSTGPYHEPDQTGRFSLAYVIYPNNLSSSEAFVTFRNQFFFYGRELLAPLTAPQAGGPPLIGCP
jgi:hypothetical protein